MAGLADGLLGSATAITYIVATPYTITTTKTYSNNCGHPILQITFDNNIYRVDEWGSRSPQPCMKIFMHWLSERIGTPSRPGIPHSPCTRDIHVSS